jgi:hypothetical protein
MTQPMDQPDPRVVRVRLEQAKQNIYLAAIIAAQNPEVLEQYGFTRDDAIVLEDELRATVQEVQDALEKSGSAKHNAGPHVKDIGVIPPRLQGLGQEALDLANLFDPRPGSGDKDLGDLPPRPSTGGDL